MKAHTAIVSLLLCISSVQESGSCPDRWFRIDDSCVLIDTNAAISRDAAYKYCQRKGAELVDPRNQAQNADINIHLKRFRCRPVWLHGGRSKDGKFHFKTRFTNWGLGEPKNYKTSMGYKDNCVQMTCSGWKANHCNARSGVMCEIKDKPPATTMRSTTTSTTTSPVTTMRSTTTSATTSTSISSTRTRSIGFLRPKSTMNDTDPILTSTPPPQNVTSAESKGNCQFLVTSAIVASLLVGLFMNR